MYSVVILVNTALDRAFPCSRRSIYILFANYKPLSKHFSRDLHVYHAAALLLRIAAANQNSFKYFVLLEIPCNSSGDIFAVLQGSSSSASWRSFRRMYRLANRPDAVKFTCFPSLQLVAEILQIQSKQLVYSLCHTLILPLNDSQYVRCRTRRTVLIAAHVIWSIFQPWLLAVMIAFYCILLLLTCFWSMTLVVSILHLISTKMEVQLWCECMWQVRTPMLLTVAICSWQLRKLARLKDEKQSINCSLLGTSSSQRIYVL